MKESTLEHILINSHKATLISYMEFHPEKFSELIKLALSDRGRCSWRAAWLLWSCITHNDRRIRRHIKQMIEVLPNLKDSQQRELLIILQKMELSKANEQCLYPLCVQIWKNEDKSSSLRFHAFKLMSKISRNNSGFRRRTLKLTGPLYTASFSNAVRKSIIRLSEFC